MPELLDWGVLALAAFGAGVLNAIAGGGTFLTLPALVWTGVPPIVANATSALAVCPGYFGSSWGFRRELASLPRRLLGREMAVCALGGVVGGLLLLVTPARLFDGLVPWLLLFATVLFAFGPKLVRWVEGAGSGKSSGLGAWRLPGLLVASVYGGYFNGGVGILLLALYLLVGESRLTVANALKNLNSVALSVVSVAAFVLGGVIVWGPALLMALFATFGGLAGARLAHWLPAIWVRAIVIATGLTMSALFFVRV